MNENDYRAAIAAGLVGAEEMHHALLYSIVETARAIFGAGGSSIFLLDEETDELVFEAICGPGDEELLGQRFPSSTGIAGWVLATRQPLVLEDVTEDPRFARDFAAQTGYVPRGLMAVPLLHEERALGVLEVLDRRTDRPFSLDEMNLLALFASQAAIALSLLGDARRARRLLDGAPDELAAAARVAEALERLEGKDRTAAKRLLEALSDVLAKG
jgi:GAF domain-containing protein